MFSKCDAWCVFSVENARNVAWKWNVGELCWAEAADCVGLKLESSHAYSIQRSFCQGNTIKLTYALALH